jgi:hypothetical protein
VPARHSDTRSPSYTVCSTNARNVWHGSEKIFNAIQLFYALINIRNNRRTLFLNSSRPEAHVWLGQYQFVYRRSVDHDPAIVYSNLDFESSWWTHFIPHPDTVWSDKDAYRLDIKKLKAHACCEVLSKSLRLLSSGMSTNNISYRIMRYWSVLETLYSLPDERASADKLIDRLLFVRSKTRWLEREIARQVYELRNGYVHQGMDEGVEVSLVDDFRNMLITHVRYWLDSAPSITHRDIVQIADLPTDKSRLKSIESNVRRKLRIIDP